MSPLRFRVTFLAFATGGIVALSSFLALSARVQEQTMYEQIKISLEVERSLSKENSVKTVSLQTAKAAE